MLFNLQQYLLKTMSNNNIANEKVCRICLETEHQEKMVTPCHCIGSVAYVHSYCVEMWIWMSPALIVHGQPSYILCQLCHEKISFQKEKLMGRIAFLYRQQKLAVIGFVLFCLLFLGELGVGIFVLVKILESNQIGFIVIVVLCTAAVLMFTFCLFKKFYKNKIKGRLLMYKDYKASKAYKVIDRRQNFRVDNQSNKNFDQNYGII